MENTSAATSGAVLDPEIALTLQQNPEAAHFIATLAAGADLRRAVIDHFGSLIAPEEAVQAPAPAPSPLPEVPQTPAGAEPGDTAETAMYRPLDAGADTEDEQPDDDFFTFPVTSVWD